MLQSQLFDDSDSEVQLETNNEYAKKYDTWRKKEELNKLKTKYGEVDINLSNDDTSSSEDDEVGIELTEEVEKDFYKTLSLLKKKDPKIYDNKTVFFDELITAKQNVQRKNNKEESMYIKDYERKLLLEKGGIVSDNEEDEKLKEDEKNPTYVEEQRQLKENLRKVAQENDSDNEDWGGMFKVRQENKEQKEKQEADYKAWLMGQKKKSLDEATATSLKPLKDYWSNPNLEDGEKFLRDYMLNKRYLEDEDENYVPTYDEIVHDSDENFSEDENAIEKQEEFEHKYNFRYEEPDQEFIKRYPRTLENTLRKEDNRRKVKRAETKDRKLKEKAEKMEELKKLREMKRKEIEEKIEKLKEITGNNEMAFNDEDIDGEFDPEEHDKRMQALFNEEYYGGPEEDQKPKFDLDGEEAQELEIENFDNWNGKEWDEETSADSQPHCEDENFIMDADYDPQKSTQEDLLENTKKRKKRRRKSKFVEELSKDRPKFDPTDRTYEQYMDEYYKLECEDIIDNIPCRFKYRQVVPNDFGLTIEEILLGKDRELNRWCSLKKAVQIRPENIEKYDQIAYSKKGQNLHLKKKLIPSLFMPENEEGEQTEDKNANKQNNKSNIVQIEEVQPNDETKNKMETKNEERKKKKKKSKMSIQEQVCEEIKNSADDVENEVKEELLNADSNNGKTQSDLCDHETKKLKKKRKKKKKSHIAENLTQEMKAEQGQKRKHNKSEDCLSKVKKFKANSTDLDNQVEKAKTKQKIKSSKSKDSAVSLKKIKKNKLKDKDTTKIKMSDARLTAYGLNPKKFKNKLKYSNKSNTK